MQHAVRPRPHASTASCWGSGGGNGVSGALSSAELYDPSTGTFSPTGSLINARMDHTATLLLNGMVLIAGGFVDVPSGNPAIASAELYQP